MMNRLLLFLLGIGGTLSADVNPIRNSSFELGRAEFGIRRFVRDNRNCLGNRFSTLRKKSMENRVSGLTIPERT